MSDFSTPEAAVLSLESAYRAQDIEAAVACKDFYAEARLMLKNLNPQLAGDEAIVSQTAEVLELSFRKHIEQGGFPNLVGISSTFPRLEVVREGLVIVTEEHRLPNGHRTLGRLYVARNVNGWRVLNPLPAETAPIASPSKSSKPRWKFWR